MNKALHHSITCMFLIIVFFAGAYKLQSQNIGRFELPHYDQLPNRQIKKIFQDSEGLIWYCTEDGLCRDDGYNIQIFRSDFKTPDVIKHNHITCITEDLSGKIWFGTLRGAYILDKNDYRITPIEGYGFDSWSIDEIKATSDGLVYIATNNKVYRFDARSTHLTHSYDIEWQGVPNKVSFFFRRPSNAQIMGYIAKRRTMLVRQATRTFRSLLLAVRDSSHRTGTGQEQPFHLACHIRQRTLPFLPRCPKQQQHLCPHTGRSPGKSFRKNHL